MKQFALIIILAVVSLPALAFQNDDTLANSQDEARADAVFKQIRCVVCKGESLAESNAELAVNIRRLIRDKVANGQSDNDIKQYLVTRYGENILQKPPFEAKTYILWLLPLVLLAGGLTLIAKIIFRQYGRSRIN